MATQRHECTLPLAKLQQWPVTDESAYYDNNGYRHTVHCCASWRLNTHCVTSRRQCAVAGKPAIGGLSY